VPRREDSAVLRSKASTRVAAGFKPYKQTAASSHKTKDGTRCGNTVKKAQLGIPKPKRNSSSLKRDLQQVKLDFLQAISPSRPILL